MTVKHALRRSALCTALSRRSGKQTGTTPSPHLSLASTSKFRDMGQLLQDLRYGLRTLARSPGFTLVAILSLALGIGANTAIFTLADAVFLNPLPVENPSRVLELFTVDHATVTTAANFTR